MNANTEQLGALIFGGLGGVTALWGSWRMIFGWRPRRRLPDEQVTERIPKYQEPRFKLLVVAGTYRQYEQYCAELGLNRYHDAVYVSDVWRVRGFRGQKYVLVGTWYDRADLREVLGTLALQNCTKI